MSDIKALEAMICLCIIDNKFHENEKKYLEDQALGRKLRLEADEDEKGKQLQFLKDLG